MLVRFGGAFAFNCILSLALSLFSFSYSYPSPFLRMLQALALTNNNCHLGKCANGEMEGEANNNSQGVVDGWMGCPRWELLTKDR